MKNSKSIKLLLAFAAMTQGSILYAQPVVVGNTIQWPDDGWYQVQDKENYLEVCAGGRSCQVSPGTYIVINHHTGERFENVTVVDSLSNISVQGSVISWPDDGWYQVLNSQNFTEVCGGGLSCDVPEGTYLVINHTTGERYNDIVVSDSLAPLDSDAIDSEINISITGNMISWSDDGWYQVQSSDTLESICEGGSNCPVADGIYNVINHTTGRRWEQLEVASVVDGATSDDSDIEETVAEETTSEDTTGDEVTAATVAFTCDEIATKFVTRGSANADLADPEVSAVCVNDTVTVTSNAIPDFPYIQTSPGVPEPNIVEYVFPATPTPAEVFTAIPIVGNIGVAINGVPIDGPTEGPGGDVNARPGGFVECGGHNGPSGYHYHLLGVTGSDYCLFSEADLLPGPQLFGYAFDGYPIFTGNNLYRSSYFLSDESLFATDTWSAHTYSAGSGDLDECNGRVDENGNYAYYTTDGFPYILGCFRGEVTLATGGGAGGPGGPGGAPQ